MERMIRRVMAIASAVLGTLGCASSSVDYISLVYYFQGPQVALDVSASITIPPGDRALVELERAMALFEIGRYDASLAALDRAENVLAADEAAGWLSESEASPWRPEPHEEVLLHTLSIVNLLALQDVVGAAQAADRGLYAINRINCEACRFTFTRYLMATAYERVGRFNDGLVAIRGVNVFGPGERVIDDLQSRLEAGVVGGQPTGIAPPPVDTGRTMVVLLLIGRGPYEVADELAVSESDSVRWFSYLPRDPQQVAWAALKNASGEVSIELTDVEDLAFASRRSRAERVVASYRAGEAPAASDLRHWGTLPASLQVIVAELSLDTEQTDLVFFSPEGAEVYREAIELPDGWTDGPLFIARRVP